MCKVLCSQATALYTPIDTLTAIRKSWTLYGKSVHTVFHSFITTRHNLTTSHQQHAIVGPSREYRELITIRATPPLIWLSVAIIRDYGDEGSVFHSTIQTVHCSTKARPTRIISATAALQGGATVLLHYCAPPCIIGHGLIIVLRCLPCQHRVVHQVKRH